MWVKAHVGLHFNEKVDRLAKEAAISGTILPNSISVDEAAKISKDKIKLKWSNMWHEYCFTNPTRYTFIHPDIPAKHWHDNQIIPRKYTTIISRIKFGHACHPTHLARLGIFQSNLCQFCNSVGDLDHLFFNCSSHIDACNELFNNLIKLKIETPFNLLSLLCLNNLSVLNVILRFINKSKIRI